MKMKILLCNDDGISAPGIKSLKNVMQNWGDIVVVAPRENKSGTSHALTLRTPLRLKKHDDNIFSVDGTPADCIYLAMLELFPDAKPDLLCSGINFGANIGSDLTYSGTVGAALEGVLHEIPSLAFSLACKKNEILHYDYAELAVEKFMQLYSDIKPSDNKVFYNINIPNLEKKSKVSFEATKVGHSQYECAHTKKEDPWGDSYFWLGGDLPELDKSEGTDSNALANGKVSITPVSFDLTNQKALVDLKRSIS